MKTSKSAHIRYLMTLAWLFLLFALPVLAQQQGDQDIQRLQEELKNVEKRQEIVLESMERSYKNGLWFLGLVAGVTALFSAIRYIQDQRTLKMLEEQVSDAKEIGKSYKNNIDTTNALMTSIKGALDYYKDAQEALKTVGELAASSEKEANRWEQQVRDLNDLAMELSPRCKRDSHNDPIIQRMVRDFHDRHEILTRSFTTKEKLNANGHFILGFHYRIENKYEEALHEFGTAVSLATTDKDESQHPSYRRLPTGVRLKEWLTKLQNICLHHKAVIYSNRGEYDKAKQHFENALQCDSLDYQSLAYIPEVMFLGGLSSFSQIITEFNNAIAKVDALTEDQERSFTLSKPDLLASLHLRLGNCYMAESDNEDFTNHRDINQAEKEIRLALSCNENSLFARLSLAQLLHKANREPEKQQELFLSVFTAAKAMVSNITEAKILLMYYYIMMICCKLGDIPNEISGVYAMRIFELVPRLPQPDSLRLFSPLTKKDLKVKQFIDEVQTFEQAQDPRESTSAAATIGIAKLRTLPISASRRSLLGGVR